MGTLTAKADSTAIGHTIVRAMVALYTVASATGVIVGTNLSLLLTPFMVDWLAQAVMAAAVTSLCFLMLAGVKRRAVALVLAVIFLWSSYFAVLGPNAQVVSGSHWRDMILIGALLLIYADAAHDEQNDISTLAKVIREPRALAETLRNDDEQPTPANMNARRTSQTLFHNDLEEYGNR